MGIDVYVNMDNKTEEEQQAQYTGFATTGRTGYLREAYHGSPYATRVLVPESFEVEDYSEDFDGVVIPSSVLRERLEATLAAVEERERTIYSSSDEDIELMKQQYRDFVAFVEQLENDGRNPRIYNSY